LLCYRFGAWGILKNVKKSGPRYVHVTYVEQRGPVAAAATLVWVAAFTATSAAGANGQRIAQKTCFCSYKNHQRRAGSLGSDPGEPAIGATILENNHVRETHDEHACP
jgi:hypothetical protein